MPLASEAAAPPAFSPGTPEPIDVYFSADVETDGPIPGPYSMLSFALVHIGSSDGAHFTAAHADAVFYRELRPIAPGFDPEASASTASIAIVSFAKAPIPKTP